MSITSGQIKSTIEEFCGSAELADDDLLVVASNPALAFDVHLVAPRAALRCRSGPDGADLALLESLHDPFWVAERFDRVVIGSGDGIFTEAVVALNHTDTTTLVIGRAGRTSSRLRLAAQDVLFLKNAACRLPAPHIQVPEAHRDARSAHG
ncbi:MAG: NYN domain-containing protein [Microthrixaceae bacterium]